MSIADRMPRVSSSGPVGIRPRLHFTPQQGWLNDPHGIIWTGNEYHLFYQHVPAGTEWAAAVHWGHAVSTDLVSWRPLPIALSPRLDEEGCWSGATYLRDGRPVILYTSVRSDDWDLGRIAVALPDADLRRWSRPDDGIVLERPPESLHAKVFRDPCLVGTAAGWTMVVGAGVGGGTGLAVQYTSPDAQNWTYGGVLCERSSAATGGIWTGSMWECPQLFRIGADWVLVVSVWDDNTLHYVAAAVGDYDGASFSPERWFRLTHDETSYAMTSFVDAEGRACLMSWLREDSSHRPSSRPWAGALSLPMLVELTPERTLRLRPHPDVDALRRPERAIRDPAGTVVVADAGRGVDVELPADGRWSFRLAAGVRELLTIDAIAGQLQVSGPGGGVLSTVPVSADVIRIVVDAGLVEIFGGDGCCARRVPADQETDVSIGGVEPGRVAIHRLAPTLSSS